MWDIRWFSKTSPGCEIGARIVEPEVGLASGKEGKADWRQRRILEAVFDCLAKNAAGGGTGNSRSDTGTDRSHQISVK